MQWLLSRDEIQATHWAETSRLPYLMVGGVLLFLGVPLGLLLTDWSTEGTLGPTLLYTLVILTLVMVPVTLFQYWDAWKASARLLDRVYNLDPDLVQMPPAESVAALPCAILFGRRRLAGGILYGLPIGLLFAPHRNGRRQGAGEIATPDTGLLIGPPTTITMKLGALYRPWLGRLLYRDRPYVLGILVEWGGGQSAFFNVPQASEALSRLQRVVDGLRATASG